LSILVPGAQPPFLVPYCCLCELPVERFTYMPVKSPYYVDIEAQCCNRTQGMHLSVDKLLQVKRSNAKLFLVTKAGRYQGVGELRRGA